LRQARFGSSFALSAETARLVLDNKADSELFFKVAQLLARSGRYHVRLRPFPASAGRADGDALREAYPELLRSQRCRLVVLAIEAFAESLLLGSVSPGQSNCDGYARDHDTAIWRTLQQLLGSPGDDEAERDQARQLAFLPARLGGLGLSSACRLRPAACWAAWADALPVLHQRRPDVAARCVREQLFEEEAAGPALREAAAAARSLEAAGWEARPAWPRLICRAHLRLQSQATCREVGKGTLLPH
ncbi:unnamed protein product, partial [Effrenium voratum]